MEEPDNQRDRKTEDSAKMAKTKRCTVLGKGQPGQATSQDTMISKKI